ncbi:MAG: hypothetical protein IJN05_07985 [Ruminococcus sp.]|nr:hypothetical protein [Ruminococcus sp.]
MFSSEEEKVTELSEEIANGKGCLVLDLACFFPFTNELTFDFFIGEDLNDKKINHRYPNKKWYTISQKQGRKVSKLGYPYFFDLKDGEDVAMSLNIKVGFRTEEDEPDTEPKNTIHFTLPLSVNVTKDNPVCGLTFKFFIEDEDCHFELYSHQPDETVEGCWTPHIWYSKVTDTDYDKSSCTILSKPEKLENKVLLYKDVIEPFACKIDELLLG